MLVYMNLLILICGYILKTIVLYRIKVELNYDTKW